MPQRPKIANTILELIGYTPLVRLNRIPYPDSAEMVCKLESQNPMDSVKDRIGVAMIDAAERAGEINPGETVLIEPTSGNTGIALALVASIKGYQLIVTMPETVTIERRRVLTALGAQVVLTPGPEGMRGAIKKATEILGLRISSFETLTEFLDSRSLREQSQLVERALQFGQVPVNAKGARAHQFVLTIPAA